MILNNIQGHERHLVSFHQGVRWENTTTPCPKCEGGVLKRDRLSNADHFKCLKCGYELIKEKEE